MNVLIVCDTAEWLKNAKPTLGGLERQVWWTAEYLRRNGCHVVVSNLYFDGLFPDDMKEYDIIHFFNTGGPKGALIMAMGMAKEMGKRVIFTPVYWPPSKLVQELGNCGVIVHERDIEYLRSGVRRLIETADVIVANAHVEWKATCDDLGLSSDIKPVFIVHNAIDPDELKHVADEPFRGKHYVFCAGRIEWRKNQIGLAMAVKILNGRGHNVNLLLAGAYAGDSILQEKLKRALQGIRAAWIGEQPAEVVYGAMRHALVYCQPSFYETPGLASLEAAALGRPLVVGGWGSEPEYFGDLAEYCVPTDWESIANAIELAMQAPPKRRHDLQKLVLHEYTYSVAAQKLLRIYRNLT